MSGSGFDEDILENESKKRKIANTEEVCTFKYLRSTLIFIIDIQSKFPNKDTIKVVLQNSRTLYFDVQSSTSVVDLVHRKFGLIGGVLYKHEIEDIVPNETLEANVTYYFRGFDLPGASKCLIPVIYQFFDFTDYNYGFRFCKLFLDGTRFPPNIYPGNVPGWSYILHYHC